MQPFHFALVGSLLVMASSFGAEVKKDEKMLIMLEFEPIKTEDRTKRASTGEAVRQERQSPEVPQEYLRLLQQLSAQQQQLQQPQQQQASASVQQAQQQLIQQLVVSRDGSRQPTAARYVLSQDGRLLEESSLAGLGQAQPLPQSFPQPQQLAQAFGQSQQFAQAFAQPHPLSQAFAQPQPLPQGFGPTQQLPQGLAQAQLEQPQQQLDPQQLGLSLYQQNPLQQTQPQQIPAAPTQPMYTSVPVDPQAYFQQQLPAQFDPSQIYGQAQRPGAVSQQLIYQPPTQQEIAQDKIRRPINVLPAPSAAQPQLVQQNAPQQYLVETSKTNGGQSPQPQFASADPAQIQYFQQPAQQPAQQPPQQLPPQPRQPEVQSSSVLQPVAGRGLFGPVKPSRSSIFVSRSSTPKSVSLAIGDDITSEKVPVVRLPSPAGQKPLSSQELDALVSAGYTVTPVQDQYLKSKRQQPLTEERRNLVVYENHQDGVQYEYSPGSSDATATIKTKKSAPDSEYFEQD